MNIGGRPQNKSARTHIKIAFVPLIISPGPKSSAKTPQTQNANENRILCKMVSKLFKYQEVVLQKLRTTFFLVNLFMKP